MGTVNEARDILTLNSGSSSIKFSLYRMGAGERLVVRGEAERIGLTDGSGGLFWMQDSSGARVDQRDVHIPDHDAALGVILDALEPYLEQGLDAVGHRVVHGGPHHSQPQRIDTGLLRELRRLVPFAPNHLPHEIRAIVAVQTLYPELPQVACFDTAFHRNMPEIAQVYPLPHAFWEEGVRRYGFHGLSYEYIVRELMKVASPQERERVIIAHLGNGASMAAVHGCQGVDTTMGFTPTGGLVMSTRSGDLDPGVVLYCFEQKGMDVGAVRELLDDQSGLLGVSGTTSDMKDLLARRRRDPRAALAVDLFCYQARKFIGALAAVLGGLDTLVFTGGIGEHAAAVRWRICRHLAFLGVELDPARNDAHAAIISRDGAACTVRVIPTDEELMIARHTAELLQGEAH